MATVLKFLYRDECRERLVDYEVLCANGEGVLIEYGDAEDPALQNSR